MNEDTVCLIIQDIITWVLLRGRVIENSRKADNMYHKKVLLFSANKCLMLLSQAVQKMKPLTLYNYNADRKYIFLMEVDI